MTWSHRQIIRVHPCVNPREVFSQILFCKLSAFGRSTSNRFIAIRTLTDLDTYDHGYPAPFLTALLWHDSSQHQAQSPRADAVWLPECGGGAAPPLPLRSAALRRWIKKESCKILIMSGCDRWRRSKGCRAGQCRRRREGGSTSARQLACGASGGGGTGKRTASYLTTHN